MSKPPKQQRSIASFFIKGNPLPLIEKRPNEDQELPQRKKPKTGVTHEAAALPQYLFSSSPSIGKDERETEKQNGGVDKAQLHQRFVKKLGKPDSIAEISRRKRASIADVDESDDAEATTRPSKGNKLTPMEKQVIEIKKDNPDTLLVIEVGYKFRFFGEDARLASKALGIVCIPGKMRYDEHHSEAHLDRFASASIPVHRLHVHVKRLVSAGHKVGIVRQLETAALKAVGSNKSGPFVRKLTNLYTKGTYIDDDTSEVEELGTGYLLCINESGGDENVHVGIVAVQPATGDVIYDDFVDGFMRSETETRLLHIAPCEVLIAGELSKPTSKLIRHLSESAFGVRIESVKEDTPQACSLQISNFYASTSHDIFSQTKETPKQVVVCLAAMIRHLKEYKLEHLFDLTKNFQSFSARSHMILNGNTLSSLEIYCNQTDNSEHGTLFWCLNRTKTKFGRRLLRKWVGRPLLQKKPLESRIGAVEEFCEKNSQVTEKLKNLLGKINNDLEKGLIRIYYGRCSRTELLNILLTLQRVALEFSTPSQNFKSNIINKAIASLPVISNDVSQYLDRINPEAARSDDKYNFFLEDEETEQIKRHKLGIAEIEINLELFRSVAASKIKKKQVMYVSVAGIEYLIEVDNTQVKTVPASWIKISGTKKLSRFHPPEVVKLIQEREQHKEALAAACDSAFSAFLSEISAKYQEFRDCIHALATLDCLLSLASVASQPGYVKPSFSNDIEIDVRQGRHPMVEQILLESYVPNDIRLSSEENRALLVTGPNMGGKSSYVRQVALISIMGQIGSYVPAASATLGMLDAIFTRMGAFDNMMAGESTFMVELSETSDILKQASPRSLVILDELGRGTSTHDGVAIAHAVLDHVVRETKCLTLFITHYQTLSALATSLAPTLRNVHMRFTEGSDETITFLYEVAEGKAFRSYGLNVARLANLPKTVIDTAAIRSKELEDEIKAKKLSSL